MFVDDAGVEHGPFDGPTLQTMAQQGHLHANTYVRHTNEAEWSLASTWPWLGFAAAPAVASAGAGGSAQISQAWRNLAQRTSLSPGTLLGIVIGIVVIIVLVIVFMGGGGGPKNAVTSMESARASMLMAIQRGDANGMLDGLEHFVDTMEDFAGMRDKFDEMPMEKQNELAEELFASIANFQQAMAQVQGNPQITQEMMTNPALQARLNELMDRFRELDRQMP